MIMLLYCVSKGGGFLPGKRMGSTFRGGYNEFYGNQEDLGNTLATALREGLQMESGIDGATYLSPSHFCHRLMEGRLKD